MILCIQTTDYLCICAWRSGFLLLKRWLDIDIRTGVQGNFNDPNEE